MRIEQRAEFVVYLAAGAKEAAVEFYAASSDPGTVGPEAFTAREELFRDSLPDGDGEV